MRIDVKECARLLLEQDDILILTHAHPDGDTLGCGFALCRALLQKGKFAYVKNEADIPPKYNYLFDDIAEELLSPCAGTPPDHTATSPQIVPRWDGE